MGMNMDEAERQRRREITARAQEMLERTAHPVEHTPRANYEDPLERWDRMRQESGAGVQDSTDAQRDAEPAAQWKAWLTAWLTARLQEEREFVLSAAGKALGQVVAQAHKDARLELSEEVRKLRIELCNMETTLNELRAVIALEKARAVDFPNQKRIN
jgi:hypothetical protein